MIEHKTEKPKHRSLIAILGLAASLLGAMPAAAQGWSAPTQLNTNDIDKPSNTGANGSSYAPYGPSVGVDALAMPRLPGPPRS